MRTLFIEQASGWDISGALVGADRFRTYQCIARRFSEERKAGIQRISYTTSRVPLDTIIYRSVRSDREEWRKETIQYNHLLTQPTIRCKSAMYSSTTHACTHTYHTTPLPHISLNSNPYVHNIHHRPPCHPYTPSPTSYSPHHPVTQHPNTIAQTQSHVTQSKHSSFAPIPRVTKTNTLDSSHPLTPIINLTSPPILSPHLHALSSSTPLLQPTTLSRPLTALAFGTGSILTRRPELAIAVAGLASLGRTEGLGSGMPSSVP